MPSLPVYGTPVSSALLLRLPDTSATRHFGIKTLRDISAPISRHLDTKNVVRYTSTRVPWSRKSRDTSTQDNSDETQLHWWFGLNFGTNFVVPKCLVAEVSGSRCCDDDLWWTVDRNKTSTAILLGNSVVVDSWVINFSKSSMQLHVSLPTLGSMIELWPRREDSTG